jgi:hypothetical protein
MQAKLPVEPEKIDIIRQKTRPTSVTDVEQPELPVHVPPVDIQHDTKGKARASWIPAQSSRHFIAGG